MRAKRLHGIITAKRLLYLRMPDSALTAEDRAQNKDTMSGGHGIITAKRLLYLRMPDSALTAEDRAQNKDTMSGGHGIITAKRLLYLRMPDSALTAEDRAQKEMDIIADRDRTRIVCRRDGERKNRPGNGGNMQKRESKNENRG